MDNHLITAYVIQTIIGSIAGAILWSYRNMQSRLDKTITKEDARDLIEDKLKVVITDIDNLKAQVERIDSNVMKLLDIQIKNGK